MLFPDNDILMLCYQTKLGATLYYVYTPDDCLRLAVKNGFNLLDLNSQISAGLYKLKTFPDHRDPFDRMLIWKSMHLNLTLITVDSQIQQYSSMGLKTYW